MGRGLVAVPAGLGAVWVLRLILGPWATALVLGPVLVAVVIAGWALLERRMDQAPPPVALPLRHTGTVIDIQTRVRPPVRAGGQADQGAHVAP